MPTSNSVTRILESGEVERFHAVPAIPAQTVAAHSWGVAIIATHILGVPSDPSEKSDLIEACLLHDTGELYTGDIPFTAKRGVFAHIKPQLDAAEAKVMVDMLWPMPELPERLNTILKLADMLEGLRWANLYERAPAGSDPIIADRWWHALNDMFASDSVEHLFPKQGERAYHLFRVLSPAMHAHRVYSSLEALQKLNKINEK